MKVWQNMSYVSNTKTSQPTKLFSIGIQEQTTDSSLLYEILFIKHFLPWKKDTRWRNEILKDFILSRILASYKLALTDRKGLFWTAVEKFSLAGICWNVAPLLPHWQHIVSSLLSPWNYTFRTLRSCYHSGNKYFEF